MYRDFSEDYMEFLSSWGCMKLVNTVKENEVQIMLIKRGSYGINANRGIREVCEKLKWNYYRSSMKSSKVKFVNDSETCQRQNTILVTKLNIPR